MPADLNIVMRMAASLLNAAGWRNLLLGSIASTSGALSVADGEFNTHDLGKLIAIDGAGAAGIIYEGRIASVTDATHVTVTPVAGTTVVGATVSYGGQLRDDRRNLFELKEAAFEADEDHYLAIGETKGHWARQDIITISPAIAHAGVLPAHLGDFGDFMIQTGPSEEFLPADVAEPAKIQRLRRNTGTPPFDTYGSLAHDVDGSQIGGYYWHPPDATYVEYSGSSLKVFFVPPYVRTAALKSPQIFTSSLVSRIVAGLLAKEGAKTPAQAQMHGAYAASVLGGIRGGATQLPPAPQ